MRPVLTRVVSWGHELLAETIREGQLAVDLTAGNGYDALMLYRLVGQSGQVVAFDIQAQALESTRQRLEDDGAVVRMWTGGSQPVPALPGIDLIKAGHENLRSYLPGKVHGIIANLGYFPSGDRQVITLPETTLSALEQACEVLVPGGRLAVVVYPGHPGGREEGAAVDGYFAALKEGDFQVLQLKVTNRPDAPYLLVAEKRN